MRTTEAKNYPATYPRPASRVLEPEASVLRYSACEKLHYWFGPGAQATGCP